MGAGLSLVLGALVVGIIVLQSSPVHAQEPGERPPSEGCRVLPANITALPAVGRLIVKVAAMSETFRRQCEFIEHAPGVRVRIVLLSRPRAATSRASTEIQRVRGGGLFATVELPIGRDMVELVAHEFEHIVEQVHGLCLRTLFLAGDAGVTQSAQGAFETAQAIRVGRLVAAEVEASDRRRRQALSQAAAPSTVRLAAAIRPRQR